MKNNEKLWRTAKQVMYESDAVNLSFSLDLQQIIDVVNTHFLCVCVGGSLETFSGETQLKNTLQFN